MKILSWNVNGIRAAIRKGFLDFVNKERPDILCVQETKARPEQVDVDNDLANKGYSSYWNSAIKKGYSGTAIFSKVKPISIVNDIGIKEHDQEGRVITAEFERFFLVNVYTPNSKEDLSRLEYRQKWDTAFFKYLKGLEKEKPVIFCGDLNVAHKEIDLARPKQNEGKRGFTKEERRGIDNYVRADFVDTFRLFNKEGENYSWWTHWANARARNVGWRIDYFLTSKVLSSNLKRAFIMPEVMGSDHCPVGIELEV